MSSEKDIDCEKILNEALKIKDRPEELIFFTLGVDLFYLNKPKGPKSPRYSAPYKDIGQEFYQNIVPVLRKFLCNGSGSKAKVRRTLAFTELIAALSGLYSQSIVVSIVAIILNRGVEEICSIESTKKKKTSKKTRKTK